MADSTYYAWAPIRSSADKDGNVKTFKAGDTVTASKLGIDEDEFQLLVGCRAVRTMQYPDMGTSQVSPVEFLKRQAADAAAGILDEATNSEEAMKAAQAANAAATGVEPPPENEDK